MLQLETVEPQQLFRPRQLRLGSSGQIEEEAEVAGAHGVGLVRRLQALAPVVTHGLEESIPVVPFDIGVDQDERLVDEAGHQVQHVLGVDPVAGTDVLGGFERPPARERREPPQQLALGFREKVMAPVNGGFERSLPPDPRTVRTGEQSKAIVEPGVDLLDRQHLQSHRRQLDRQRYPVEAPAHVRDHGGVFTRDRERGTSGCRSIDQQSNSLVLEEIVGWRDARFGHSQRGNSPRLLAGDAECFAARGEKRQPGRSAEQRFGELGDAGDHVFAIVEQQKHAAMAQLIGQRFDDRPARQLTDVQH